MFRQMTKEKESWLTKLIELLNEYEKHNKSDLYYKFKLENWELYCYNDVSDVLWTMQDEAMVICSKKFWFIKWLVENEKIKPLRKFIGWETDEDEPYIQFDLVDQYIAYLSIQDNPIEFLVSILK